MSLRAVFTVLALSGLVSAQAGMYQQCGGIGYSGTTECVAGAYCNKLSDYYSQCTPGAVTTAPSPSTSANPSSPSPSGSYTIIAGGYSSAVATYQFTPSAGTLTLLSQSTTGQNPSWIALHPTNRSILYATNENWNGGAQAFAVRADGSLASASSTVSSGGADPAHLLPLSLGGVAVMNYDGGNGVIMTTSSSNPLALSPGPTITFQGSPSHPHEAYEVNGELLIPDLGADTIWRLGNSGGSWSVKGQLTQPKGSGPRHVVVVGTNLFVLHELSSTLSVQSLPSSQSGSSSPSSTVSTPPSDGPSGARWQAAEILIPPTSSAFPTQYIYVSNRNTASGATDSRGDSIAIFSFDAGSGALSLVKQVFTGLSQVRGMMFGGPDAAYIIAGAAAGQGGVGVWKRTDGGKSLELVVRNTQIATRTSFVWL